ncbi:carboxynorspermidine decarboxylase [Helicobacter sp. 11S02629-2]|uniref:carboxynorspermidine decarboxylase n=1 Tax=Helicobacter sp. 11S02629-2 TaxID=1476195 RepID=UPI000BA74CCB|nr:carboxynorspermidine decarboxylase [Helicobacter sp. 11S02629-2]PAF43511.1 carboxynorspermidine decarboxylase [Helicobacter sp. 11S02629-2]
MDSKSRVQNRILKHIDKIPSPCYVLDYEALQSNIDILDDIAKRSKAKVLVALKGYAFWREFDYIRQKLSGATCSGLHEAKLAYEELACKAKSQDKAKEVCVFSPAYKDKEIDSLLPIASTIIFNSFNQLTSFIAKIKAHNKHLDSKVEIGLRVNPLYSEVKPLIYNPCAPKSRLGITPSEFEKHKHLLKELDIKLDGIHFHTHCEQDSKALEKTLEHFEKHFGAFIKEQDLKWVNFGGGHHITRKDYDRDLLVSLIAKFKKRYNDIEVLLEPGEAIGWQVGDLVGSVIDIVENEGKVAVLDVSASNHMPDCLEMPYRPSCYKISRDELKGKHLEEDKGETIGTYKYRFGGPTCLAGDIIGDFSFNTPLNIGDKVCFKDMIHYTIVKNTTFNGIELPSLGVIKEGDFKLLKSFGYNDYKERN